MEDIDKEAFCFDLYNQLQDEFGVVDEGGKLARQIQFATGKELDNILRYLQSKLLESMRPTQ